MIFYRRNEGAFGGKDVLMRCIVVASSKQHYAFFM